MEGTNNISRVARLPGWPLRRGGWRTVVTDPPWMFRDQGSRLGTTRCSSPYEPMPDEEILALPMALLGARDSHLYCWATDEHTELALKCVRTWGWRFVQFLPWVKVDARGKPRLGGGHYFRHAHEHCLFAVRGSAPGRRHDLSAVFFGGRGRHSAKPAEFYDRVDAFSPGPKVELFARVPRRGWSAWGDQLRSAA